VIQHIVLIKPKTGVDSAAIEAAREGLVALSGVIPGLLSVAWGRNISAEGKSQGFELGFVMEFAGPDDIEVYLPHPEHTKVQPLIRGIAEQVLVFDLEA
jgi:hypothetical protein